MTSREQERTSLLLLGVGAAMFGLLIDVGGLVAAFQSQVAFSANVLSLVFLGFVLGIAGYFMGARRLGATSAISAVAVIPIGAVLAQLLH